MTTTSTFQGMDNNAKPSSRVLAPPGGGSSNIFGGYSESDDKNARGNPQNARGSNNIFGAGEQVLPSTSPGKRHNPSNVNCGNNDIFHRESHAAAAQPKSRAPRSGDNSFQKLFGDSRSGAAEVLQGSVMGNRSKDVDRDRETQSKNEGLRAQPRHSDSFANVLGVGGAGNRDRRAGEASYSFSNILNQQTESPSRPNLDHNPNYMTESPLNPLAVQTKSYENNVLPTSLNDLSISGGESFLNDDHDIDSSFSRVLGQYQATVTPRANRFSDRGEFNPITGEAYAQPARKEEEEKKEEEQAAEDQQKPGAESGVAEAPAKVQPSTRVSQPPGGRSTKLW